MPIKIFENVSKSVRKHIVCSDIIKFLMNFEIVSAETALPRSFRNDLTSETY